MKIDWSWADGQKTMTITLTPHEANEVYLGLCGESEISRTIKRACLNFYEKGYV